MISLRRPRPSAIEAFRARQQDAALSYREVGATAAAVPSGYNVDHREVVVAAGTDGFARARDAMRTWQQFAGAGGRIRVVPPAPPLEAGATVVLFGRHLGIYTLSACRVVYVIDEPRRFGFAYGTLEHAVRGEELFELVHRADDSVRFRLLAFSVPASLLVWLGSPLVRHFQRGAAGEYARALSHAVAK